MVNFNINWLLLISGLGVLVLACIIAWIEEKGIIGKSYSAEKKDIVETQNLVKAQNFFSMYIFHHLRNSAVDLDLGIKKNDLDIVSKAQNL